VPAQSVHTQSIGRPSFIGEPALAWTLAICIVLRLSFYQLYHLSFDANPSFWQMQDVEWLRQAPIQAIYLMHMQPPALNALYALSLALPAGQFLLPLLFIAVSLLVVTLLYIELRRFGHRPAPAALMAGLFGVLPQTLVYENVFGYQHLEAGLLLSATLLAPRFLASGRAATYAGFAACVVTLALLRSQYHLGWVVLVLLAVAVLRARLAGWNWGVLVSGVAATAVVAGVYVKNGAEFGSFSASSWLGMTTAQMVTPFMSGDREDFPEIVRDLDRRTQRHEFSPAMTGVVAKKSVWYGWMNTAQDCTENGDKRPPLCSLRRPGGMENFNHVELLTYSAQLGKDALHLLRLYPALYVDHLVASIITTLGTPSWEYHDLPQRIHGYAAFWNRLMLYTEGHALDDIGGTGNWLRTLFALLAAASLPTAAFVVVSTSVIVSRGARQFLACWLGKQIEACWIFPALALLLVFTVPHVINGVETQRIRYTVEPILYLAFIEGVRSAVRVASSAFVNLRPVLGLSKVK
jgi:hypothetical protein